MAGLWGKRFAALIIDFIMITLFLWVIIALLYPVIAMTNLFALLNVWIPIAAFIIIVYFTYFEGKYCTTPGKNLMKLKIRAIKGEMGYKKALVRSLSKILWLPLIVDMIIGLFMSSPKKRLLDRLAKTEVVSLDEVEPPLKVMEQSTS
ncbi:MAG: RDD family protein [Methanobacterium sp.]|nr:RDD family protein [Methanobacterium sp.]